MEFVGTDATYTVHIDHANTILHTMCHLKNTLIGIIYLIQITRKWPML
jgi:hypothetical protein